MDKVNIVPGFILKLWKMINDPQCDDLISWSNNGESFIIIDPAKFSQELSKYFKHNNLSSFIRQLNMYGFRKVTAIENSGLHPGTEDLHFIHPDFHRDKPERLESIKRKLPQKLVGSVDLRNVIKGISEIEDKQKDVSKTLTDIKRENEMLWAELHDLRQKHHQQQLYISRLMKLVFEVMEQNGIQTNMLQLKRAPTTNEDSSHTQLTTMDMPALEPSYQVLEECMQQDGNHINTLVPLSAQLATIATTGASSTSTIAATASPVIQQPLETTYEILDQGIGPKPDPIDTLEPMNTQLSTPVMEPAYQVLEESINCNGDQIDNLVPSLVDFSDENMDELFSN